MVRNEGHRKTGSNFVIVRDVKLLAALTRAQDIAGKELEPLAAIRIPGKKPMWQVTILIEPSSTRH